MCLWREDTALQNQRFWESTLLNCVDAVVKLEKLEYRAKVHLFQ